MIDKTLIRDFAFHTLLANTSDMIFVKNADFVYVASSVTFAKMTGKDSIEEVLGKTDFEIFDDVELAKRYRLDDEKLFADGKNLVDYVEPLTDEEGRARYSSTSKFILRDNDGNIAGLLGISRDITREYTAKLHHQRELQYMFELPKDIYSAVLIDIDDWRIIGQRRHFVNDFMMPAHDNIDDMVDNALRSIPDDESARSFFCQFSQEGLQSIYQSGQRSLSMEYLRHTAGRNRRWVSVEATYLTEPAKGHLCAMFFLRDIDAEKKAEIELIQAARIDEMTGLLNRNATMHAIEDFLSHSRHKVQHALFMIDIDNFKILNDTYGHQAGDEFLTTIAGTIKNTFRETDIVGRIGGDEFFALMKNASDMEAIVDKGVALLHAIQGVCNERSDMTLSGSIGISLFPSDGGTLDELYASADDAMYQAKQLGKNQFAFASEIKL